MTDPLSIAASVAGLCTLAESVGICRNMSTLTAPFTVHHYIALHTEEI
jgi:hypothetical protein